MAYSNALKPWLGRKSCINFLQSRNICCCRTNFDKSAAREGRFMRKLMRHETTGKKSWYKSAEVSNVPLLLPRTSVPKRGHNYRRISVLNKLFMRHITDLMATSEVSNEILGRGIEISRVKMAPDFNTVNVFWLAKGTEHDVEVEEILKRSAGQLRHELSQLRVMGIVPRIQFIKDKEYAKIVDVDGILATADFGEDYNPVDTGHRLKSEFMLNKPLPPEVKCRIKKLEEELLGDDVPEPPLSPMRMDVLGLQHNVIMAKVKQAMMKSKAPHRHGQSIPLADSSNSESITHSVENANHDDTFSLKEKEFTEFLLKRHLMQKKAQRGTKNRSLELDLYEREILEGSSVATDFMDSVKEEKDYIDENEDIDYK